MISQRREEDAIQVTAWRSRDARPGALSFGGLAEAKGKM